MPARLRAQMSNQGDSLRIGLVGCVKSKQSNPAIAADLYTSALFRGRRRWVETTCGRWFVLSAKHGLVSPTEMLEPYDETLTTNGLAERRVWSERVLAQLHEELGDLGRYIFEVHAGSSYVDHGLAEGLRRAGAKVELPARGRRQGEQLALYKTGPPQRN